MYNNLCAKLIHEGFECITVNQLIGVILTHSGKESQKSGRDISDYDIIIFEEIYCIPTTYLAEIYRLMLNNPDINYYANGDPYQIKPIENLSIKNLPSIMIILLVLCFRML
eukprot:Lithocolla_globosa_v1_NODE_4348_length_1456_cov_35.966453.p3 type:complete len:111 gc:universal NODE_4348_length_1456_cov_35.966453:672-1004(+)